MMVIFTGLVGLPPLMTICAPLLKPIHPHHNIKVPNTTLEGFPIANSFSFPFSKRPNLGPSTTIPGIM